MSFKLTLLHTYESNIEDLKIEKEGITYYQGYDGEIVEKYVTCNRPNCICHSGFPHGPNKYFRYKENGKTKEKYLGKKIADEYITKVESNKRYKEIERELKVLKTKVKALRKELGLADENGEGIQMTLEELM